MGRQARNLLVIALVLGSMVAAGTQETGISATQAKYLVRIVLDHQGFPSISKYCQIESMDKDGPFVPQYYSFSAFCDFPNTAATSPWGEYVVSPRTGDVLGFETCTWFHYPELGRMQKRIVARTHAADAGEGQYRERTGCTVP